MKCFADIILPLPLEQTYTYEIPENIQDKITIGMRVIVHFGKSRFYTGIITNIHKNSPEYTRIKPISVLIDDTPTVLPKQLQFWQFISKYYQAVPGDIYKTALPSALRLESESYLSVVPELAESYTPSESQKSILNQLSKSDKTSISKFNANELKSVRQLIEKGIVAKTESLTNNYKPKFEDYVSLNKKYLNNKNDLEILLKSLGKAKKQCELIEQYIKICNGKAIKRTSLLEQTSISSTILKALIEKGIFVVEKHRSYRIDISSEISSEIHKLSPIQVKAYNEIKDGFSDKNTVLLHGVTSSGKTEIYIQLIKDFIEKGAQVLMLVPEVGLTQQLANRMKQFFGGEMGVYHTFCSSYERVEIYQHQLSDNPYKLILGVRSSIFLPFKNLGLIIVDEEHDMGYKQIDPSPRYNARDAAIYLAYLHNAKTILGSATPSIDSYANCHFGKYKLVELNERYGDVKLPKVKLIDLNESYRKRQMKGHFSLEMIKNINDTINAGHQVILFQNRRGFSPYIECKNCGYVPKCPNCDVSLTYHRFTDSLTCHYCGHTQSMMTICPTCGHPSMSTHGFGTEQVEEEAIEIFPDYHIARLDLDTSRTLKSFDNIVSSFQDQKIDILIGTQMVAKGIDFNNVGLVGILNADNLLYYPDFRAYERAFQMLVQVSGRTGRHTDQSLVIIQSSQTDNPIIRQILSNDYKAFFTDQMSERHAFHYPPYYRLIRLTVKHTDQNICKRTAEILTNKLRLRLGNRILGPDIPPIGRVQNRYINQILIKIEITAPINKAKEIISSEIQGVLGQKPYNTSIIQIDVDPL